MKSCLLTLLITLSMLCFSANAQTTPAENKKFKSESEAGAVVVSGNSSSESYSLKSDNSYAIEKNIFRAFGRYIRTTANGTESARSWEAGTRYERELSELFSAFVGHKAESDVYAGYTQRDSQDLGGKYFFRKEDELTWFAELGYRYSTTLLTTGDKSYDSFGRLYTEIKTQLRQDIQLKYWAEYLPNFSNSKAYLANTEASVSVMLNDVFSLKMAYLLQYKNVVPAGAKYTDTTYTTSLVAKF